jgi:importin subunit alpha-1
VGTVSMGGRSEGLPALWLWLACQCFAPWPHNPFPLPQTRPPQAVWGVSNIAGDCVQNRDALLADGAMASLLNYMGRLSGGDSRLSALRTSAWALSNLVRGTPPPEFALVQAALPTLARLLRSKVRARGVVVVVRGGGDADVFLPRPLPASCPTHPQNTLWSLSPMAVRGQDEEVVQDCCWAVSYLTNGSVEAQRGVLASDLVPIMTELLCHTAPVVLTPITRALGNLCAGEEQQVQAVLDAGALPHLVLLAQSTHVGTAKEACWTLSNIAGGPPHHAMVGDGDGGGGGG